jgi:hypothetical protein
MRGMGAVKGQAKRVSCLEWGYDYGDGGSRSIGDGMVDSAVFGYPAAELMGRRGAERTCEAMIAGVRLEYVLRPIGMLRYAGDGIAGRPSIYPCYGLLQAAMIGWHHCRDSFSPKTSLPVERMIEGRWPS